MTIKGKYRATVEIEFAVDEENTSLMRPYEEIKNIVKNDFIGYIDKAVNNYIDVSPFGTISVKQEEAEVWKE